MRIIIITFLFILFSSNYSLAKNNEKITLEEIRNSLITMEAERNYRRFTIEQRKSKTLEKRSEFRKYLKSACDNSMSSMDPALHCQASIIKKVFQRSEQGEVRRPGDIFYALVAIERLVFSNKTRNKFVSSPNGFKKNGKMYYYWSDSSNKYNKYNGPLVEVKSEDECVPWLTEYYDNAYLCSGYSKYTLKKLKKFQKNPSNEKVLGKPLIKHLKNVRLVKKIRTSIGTGNFELVGDMLNASVRDVVKNNVRPELAKRRNLLNKYNQILSDIKNKLDEDKFKSIDKNVLKLAKAYNNLQKLNQTSYNLDKEVDEAIDIIFDINKLIEQSTLKAKDDKEEKLLAMASIYFMDSLIDSILYKIPKKYRAVVNKELNPIYFDDYDVAELDKIIKNMIKKNNDTKFAKTTWSMNIINKYVDTSNILQKLNELGIQNNFNKPFTQISALNVAEEQIEENLNKELFKDVKKIVSSVSNSDLNDITRQVSQTANEVSRVASEIASDPSIKSTATKYNSVLEHKFGGVPLKALIYMSR